jgi:hypothetical protein
MCVCAAVVLAVACAGRVNSDAPLPAELLARAESEQTVRVVVELQGGLADIQISQGLVLQALEGTHYRVTRRYQTIPFLALEVSTEALRRLAHSPVVRRIQEDRLASPQEKTP